MVHGVDPWMSAMRRGDFQAAWRVSDEVLEARRRGGVDCSSWPRHLQFLWDGTPIDGKHVLVQCYHGLGDTLQFAQLLEPLRARAGATTLCAQPPLLDVLKHVRGIDRLLPLHEDEPDIERDVDIESMEVAHALRIDSAQLPWRSPYLVLSPLPHAVVDPARLNVGLAWRSGAWDRRRSIPSRLLTVLGDAPVQWHSLQFPPEPLPFAATQMACRDIHEMARRMLQLDVVITVDTMVAHLAAALGLRIYLLLARHADWRWGDLQTRSPWYPSVRICRRRTSWTDLLLELRHHLAQVFTRSVIPARGRHSNGCRASSD
jgi:hypothetical protein